VLPLFKVQATEVFFGTKEESFSVGSKIEIGVFANTSNEAVNAVGGDIAFPKDVLELSDIYDGNSALSLWVKRPVIVSPGVVSFAGITPGGINEPKAYLFTLVLTAKKEGTVKVEAQNEQILLNDGNGSLSSLSHAPLTINIVSEGKPSVYIPPFDQTPPEPFNLQIAKNDDVFNGKWFVTFAAQDKGAGIRGYEVRELPPSRSLFGLFSNKNWQQTESPYLLKNQSLENRIEVAAIDREGNKRIAISEPLHQLPFYKDWVFWLVSIVLVVFVYKYWSFLKKQKTRI